MDMPCLNSTAARTEYLQSNPSFDLATQHGDFQSVRTQFHMNGGNTGDFMAVWDFVEYLKTNDSPFLKDGKLPVFTLDGYQFCTVNRGLVFDSGCRDHYCYHPESRPIFVILPEGQKRNALNKKYETVVINNGDEDNGDYYDSPIPGMPTVSFQCVTALAAGVTEPTDEEIIQQMRRFNTGSLKLLDYTEDEIIKLTRKEKAQLNNKNKPNPKPPIGFTLVGDEQWHRSATCLIYDSKRSKTYLVGQDEGTYFGVELADNPTTVKAAYTSLTPLAARKTTSQRQGEWFMVPVSDKEVVAKEKAIFLFDEHGILPVDHADANLHTINCDDGRVAPDGTVFAYNAYVRHDQHREISASGWVKFVRNTATRSVSVEGVD